MNNKEGKIEDEGEAGEENGKRERKQEKEQEKKMLLLFSVCNRGMMFTVSHFGKKYRKVANNLYKKTTQHSASG